MPSSSPFSSQDAKLLESSSNVLSNDALYAPLSTYDISKGNSQEKNRHSLTLQTSSTLRESSLLTFLTNTCQRIKTSHPYEAALYRGIGGSIAKLGMGDNDHAGYITKSAFESKLSNRSLVLVGGGVHSHASRSEEAGVTSIIETAASSVSGKKRGRKRVGGNGMFGSLSKRKRKKILLGKHNKSTQLNRREDSDANGKREPTTDDKTRTDEAALPNSIEDDIRNTIETLHNMWMNYMSELVATSVPSSTNKSIKTSDDKTSIHPVSMTPQLRRQMSMLLVDAEHTGMAATIVECPSRRHLEQLRCVVVNETESTWRVATLMLDKKSRRKKGSPTAAPTAASIDHQPESTSRCWNIIMIPKHGTILNVSVLLQASSSSPSQNASTLSVRIET